MPHTMNSKMHFIFSFKQLYNLDKPLASLKHFWPRAIVIRLTSLVACGKSKNIQAAHRMGWCSWVEAQFKDSSGAGCNHMLHSQPSQ